MPDVTLPQIASASAHKIAAVIAEAEIPPPESEIVRVAVLEDAGIRVVVSITRYDGPARLHPTTAGEKRLSLSRRPLADLQEGPGTASAGQDSSANGENWCLGVHEGASVQESRGEGGREGREINRCIMEAAPGPGARSVTIKRLAALAGYAYSRYFRDAVAGLVDQGRLMRSREGVRRR